MLNYQFKKRSSLNADADADTDTDTYADAYADTSLEALHFCDLDVADSFFLRHHHKHHNNHHHLIIIITRPWPAFGRQGLVGSSGGYTYHGYTSHASPRACGARLGRKVSRNGRNVISPIYRQF